MAVDKFTIEMMIENKKEPEKSMKPFNDTVIRKVLMPREKRETV